MNKTIFVLALLFLSSCSTFTKEAVTCPNTTSPKGAEEIVANSENGSLIYMGLRGIELYCTINGSDINMEALINIRAIRSNPIEDDSVPVMISIVSIDINNKEYDRDQLSYSQFLLKGSKIVDRITAMNIIVPIKGKVLIGIK